MATDMKLPDLMISPPCADDCAEPRRVRLFTILKLLVLVLLVLILVLLPKEVVEPPSLELPPLEVLAWPALSGRGTPGSTVEVISNNQPLGRAEVGEDGRWRIVPRPALSPGSYHLAARAVDGAGETVAAGPEGEGRLAVVGLPTLAIAAGAEEAGRVALTLSGEGTPGSVLRVVHNEAILAPARVNEAGHWAVSVWVARPSENDFYVQLLAGDESVLGRSEDAAFDVGVDGGPGPDGDLTVESVRFDDPIRAEGPEGLGFVAGWLDVAGTGAPGRVVTILSAGEGEGAGEMAAVGPDGRWAARFFAVLVPGDHGYRARMAAEDGRLLGERSFTVVVPAPPALAIEGGRTDSEDVVLRGRARPNRPVSLTLDGEPLATVESDEQGLWQYTTRLQAGTYAFLALDGRLASERGEIIVALDVPVITGQATDGAGQLVAGLYGRGRPNTRLEILEGEVPVGQAAVDAAGDWRCGCTLPPGKHTLSVRELAEPQRASRPGTLEVFNPSPGYVPGPADPNAPPFRCPEDSAPGQIAGRQYIIGCGEGLAAILGRLGVTVEQLLLYNPQLDDPPRFYFGQVINIPQAAACFDEPA
jgi:hypothetical protein